MLLQQTSLGTWRPGICLAPRATSTKVSILKYFRNSIQILWLKDILFFQDFSEYDDLTSRESNSIYLSRCSNICNRHCTGSLKVFWTRKILYTNVCVCVCKILFTKCYIYNLFATIVYNIINTRYIWSKLDLKWLIMTYKDISYRVNEWHILTVIYIKTLLIKASI